MPCLQATIFFIIAIYCIYCILGATTPFRHHGRNIFRIFSYHRSSITLLRFVVAKILKNCCAPSSVYIIIRTFGVLHRLVLLLLTVRGGVQPAVYRRQGPHQVPAYHLHLTHRRRINTEERAKVIADVWGQNLFNSLQVHWQEPVMSLLTG